MPWCRALTSCSMESPSARGIAGLQMSEERSPPLDTPGGTPMSAFRETFQRDFPERLSRPIKCLISTGLDGAGL